MADNMHQTRQRPYVTHTRNNGPRRVGRPRSATSCLVCRRDQSHNQVCKYCGQGTICIELLVCFIFFMIGLGINDSDTGNIFYVLGTVSTSVIVFKHAYTVVTYALRFSEHDCACCRSTRHDIKRTNKCGILVTNIARTSKALWWFTFLLSICSVFLWYYACPISLGPPTWLRSNNRDVYGPTDGLGEVSKTIGKNSGPKGDARWNWGNTFSFHPSVLLVPKSVSDVQTAVQKYQRIRVVGGGHSWGPLIATEHASMDLRYMNHIDELVVRPMNVTSRVVRDDEPSHSIPDNTDRESFMHTVTLGAGAKIRHVQHALLKRGFVLHGFGGGTHHQSIAGGISTNLHGSQNQLFAEHVLQLGVVLANATYVVVGPEDALFHAVKSGMGLLGVVTMVRLRVFPRRCKRRLEFDITLDSALDRLFKHNIIAEFKATEYGLRHNKGVFHEYLDHGDADSCPLDFPREQDRSSSEDSNPYFTDNWLMPLQVMFVHASQWSQSVSFFKDRTIKDTSQDNNAGTHTQGENRKGGVILGIENGWRYEVSPLFGQLFTEYSIPRDECRSSIGEILKLAKQNGFILSTMTIRRLDAETGTLLAYAPTASCALEVYSPPYQPNLKEFFLGVQHIVYEHGGRSHLGKTYFPDTRPITTRSGKHAMQREAAFWGLVAKHDPYGLFAMDTESWNGVFYIDFDALYIRATVFRVAVWSSLWIGLAWMFSLCCFPMTCSTVIRSHTRSQPYRSVDRRQLPRRNPSAPFERPTDTLLGRA
jgi:hypothetical protein